MTDVPGTPEKTIGEVTPAQSQSSPPSSVVAPTSSSGPWASPVIERGVYVSTYGCQMNVNDSERMYSLLEMQNYTPVSSPEQAELIIINSCSVREKPVHKVFSEVGTFRKLKERTPHLKIGVGGCVGSHEKDNLIKTAPLIDFVFGTDNIDQLPEIVGQLDAKGPGGKLVETRFQHRAPYHVETLVRSPGVSTFVNITKGYDNFCTFCVVPYTRGREKSRPLKHVLEDVRRLVSRGVKEVTVLGQNVNSYESDCGADFADLLERLATETDVQRIRFTTSHPKDFDQKLVEVMYRNQPKVCEYIHLPFQSGNSRILNLMNRGYTREEYLEKIAMIRRAIPNVVLSTDIIVGFPGETEEDFEFLLDWLEEAEIDRVGCFEYEPVTGAPANELEGLVPDEVKRDRYERLMEVAQDISAHRLSQKVGRTIDVLVDDVRPEEGKAIARSQWDAPEIDGQVIVANAQGIKPGDKVAVLVTGSDEYDLFAEPVAAAKDQRPVETAAV